VYVWDNHPAYKVLFTSHFGHASIMARTDELPGGQSYISWWPGPGGGHKGNKKSMNQGSSHTTFYADCHAEMSATTRASGRQERAPHRVRQLLHLLGRCTGSRRTPRCTGHGPRKALSWWQDSGAARAGDLFVRPRGWRRSMVYMSARRLGLLVACLAAGCAETPPPDPRVEDLATVRGFIGRDLSPTPR
jgi:hypothetical protein